MRINIEIDDHLMANALAVTGLKTEQEVIELGLRKVVQLKHQEEIRLLRGKIDWRGNLNKTRTD
ncbi:type II toxin-antitoxin system VapB family antitoxin [Burkholderia gladioli]|uniref:type II toxin-antitoxin system VapB family antitoxin n=1 Tax=Burkholderia gladioli TaxID=28095 RepID=UPI00163EF963|nr:type II toxin-antitoxin system VapB family antitoxin [Burkholderia gladioli]